MILYNETIVASYFSWFIDNLPNAGMIYDLSRNILFMVLLDLAWVTDALIYIFLEDVTRICCFLGNCAVGVVATLPRYFYLGACTKRCRNIYAQLC